jgi:hypothetical protein
METTFTYTILRYVHDIATGEFVNMGVALYAPEAKYVSAICNSRYGRLSKLFRESPFPALSIGRSSFRCRDQRHERTRSGKIRSSRDHGRHRPILDVMGGFE